MSGFKKPQLPIQPPANGFAIVPSNTALLSCTKGSSLVAEGVVVSEIFCGGAGIVRAWVRGRGLWHWFCRR